MPFEERELKVKFSATQWALPSLIRGRPQIKVRTSFEVRTSIEVCSTSIEVRLQPHFGLIGHSLVVTPYICSTLFHWSNSQSLSNNNQATKFTEVLTLLDAMLLTVKLREQQGVNIYLFEVVNMYCQLKEIMDFRKDSLKYKIINL